MYDKLFVRVRVFFGQRRYFMIKKPFKDIELSMLGLGNMRFHTSDPKGESIIDKDAFEVIDYAYKNGINYFDTAYVYSGSEAALGEILKRNNARATISIATKLPHYLVKNADSMEKYFQEQLKRLQTDHVDYYLMHMLTDVKTWERLMPMN